MEGEEIPHHIRKEGVGTSISSIAINRLKPDPPQRHGKKKKKG